ncbi:MAG: glycosyltransferase family 2 protein [Actinomycetota bacterium]
MKLSCVIIALNEEAMIDKAIASCSFADEVLVVDGGSTDRTIEIAKHAGARIAERPFDDFARQRTFGLEQAHGEWVLFVDADERVTPELQLEIEQTLVDPMHNGYAIPRRNMVLGQWLRWHFGGEDAPVRLVRRERAKLEPKGVHEVIAVDGESGTLHQPLLHYTHRSVTDLIDKINRYSSIEANELAASGARRPATRAIVAEFPRSFWRYWMSGLRREGEVGAIEAAMLAFNRTLVLAKLWELKRDEPMAETYSRVQR